MIEFNSRVMDDVSIENKSVYSVIDNLIDNQYIVLYRFNLYYLKYRYTDVITSSSKDTIYRVNIIKCIDYARYSKFYKLLYI